jgi:hypothetical protein
VQALRSYIADLCDCLGDKSLYVEELEEHALEVLTDRAEGRDKYQVGPSLCIEQAVLFLYPSASACQPCWSYATPAYGLCYGRSVVFRSQPFLTSVACGCRAGYFKYCTKVLDSLGKYCS